MWKNLAKSPQVKFPNFPGARGDDSEWILGSIGEINVISNRLPEIATGPSQ